LAPAATLQGIVHEGPRTDTKTSLAVARGLRRSAIPRDFGGRGRRRREGAIRRAGVIRGGSRDGIGLEGEVIRRFQGGGLRGEMPGLCGCTATWSPGGLVSRVSCISQQRPRNPYGRRGVEAGAL